MKTRYVDFDLAGPELTGAPGPGSSMPGPTLFGGGNGAMSDRLATLRAAVAAPVAQATSPIRHLGPLRTSNGTPSWIDTAFAFDGTPARDGSSPPRTSPDAGPETSPRRAPETPDHRLERLQAGAVRVGQREVGRVREEGGENRGPAVEAIQAETGLHPGDRWCGGWVAHAYDRSAASEGGRYTRSRQLLSDRDARNHFLYQNANGTFNDALRERHAAEGSQRRYMTLVGPGQADHVARQGQNHEVYDDHRALPIRPGDTVVMNGHVAMVQSYDRGTGRMRILEGNAGANTDRVDNSRVIDLSRATGRNSRASVQGFGRPALGDFRGISPGNEQSGH